MKNRKAIFALIAVAVLIAAMAGVYLATRPETAAGDKTITVTVIHKDGTEKVFEYQTSEEYLGPVILSEGLVEGAMEQYGLVISAVDGETADWNVDQSYWGIFIGEEYATTGADGVAITDGGSYSLVYTFG